MKKMIAAVLCMVVPVIAAQDGYKIKYDGGSVQDVKAGTDLRLYIDANQIRLVRRQG